ncbi:class I SAM-dependent methyltransferase [Alphaproteobacteria bacterium]|nr:class I SAM-dependent methyltransferase [Alphaproteobacteria bacterium]
MKSEKNIKRLKGTNVLDLGISCPVVKEIDDFYNVAPFPNYEDTSNKNELLEKVLTNEFLRDFKRKVGFGKSFIEVGCGTGQLSIAMAIGTNNEIVGFDATEESLRLADKFSQKIRQNNVTFLRGDLFDDPFEKECFDYVWCSGVLHHTKNTKDGLKKIASWVKPGGTIVVGLYNTYGRTRTRFGQLLVRIFGDRHSIRRTIELFDPILRSTRSSEKANAWFRDQYIHPVERTHTLDEVLEWFEEFGIEFKGSIPDPFARGLFVGFDNMDGEKGTFASRVFSQISMNFSRFGAEGGLFICFGIKR